MAQSRGHVCRNSGVKPMCSTPMKADMVMDMKKVMKT